MLTPGGFRTASRHNLKEEALFRQGPNAEGLKESVATMVGIAEAELRTSRACFDGTSGIPEKCFPAFLAAVRFFPSFSCGPSLGNTYVSGYVTTNAPSSLMLM